MSLKTDFIDGDVFYSGVTTDNDKLNGITNTINNKLLYKSYSSAAEVTASVSAWTDTAKTFTITHPANTILIGVYFQGSVKSADGGSPVGARIHISGTSLGSIYTVRSETSANSVSSAYARDVRFYIGSGTSVGSGWFYLNDTSYESQVAYSPTIYNLPDTSTTFTVQLTSNNDNTKTAYIKDVVIRLILAEATDLG